MAVVGLRRVGCTIVKLDAQVQAFRPDFRPGRAATEDVGRSQVTLILESIEIFQESQA